MLIQIVLESIPQVQEAALGVAMAGIGLLQTALGFYQKFKSDQALKAIAAEEQAKFEVDVGLQRSQQRAEALAEQGFTPEETATFEQRIAGEGELAFRRATDISGGNLAQSIGGALQAQRIGAIGEFAARGAQLKRQNIRFAAGVAGQVQQQRNLETQRAIADRLRREQAFGQAGQAGLENIVGGLTTGFALGTGGIGEGAGSTTGLTSRQFVPQSVDEFTTLNRRQLSIQGLR